MKHPACSRLIHPMTEATHTEKVLILVEISSHNILTSLLPYFVSLLNALSFGYIYRKIYPSEEELVYTFLYIVFPVDK